MKNVSDEIFEYYKELDEFKMIFGKKNIVAKIIFISLMTAISIYFIVKIDQGHWGIRSIFTILFVFILKVIVTKFEKK